MAFIKSLGIWVVTYTIQIWFGEINNWHLTSIDFYMFYGVATLMMVVSYVFGRLADIEIGQTDIVDRSKEFNNESRETK